jgi:hypothetical protein
VGAHRDPVPCQCSEGYTARLVSEVTCRRPYASSDGSVYPGLTESLVSRALGPMLLEAALGVGDIGWLRPTLNVWTGTAELFRGP